MTTINNLLAGYTASQADEAAIKRSQTPIKVFVPQAAVDKAASTARSSTAAQKLEAAQQALGTELRAALAKAGVKLQGRVEFTVKSDGSVSTSGSEADKAAVKAFLAGDTSQPSFASRIASQAKEALKLSASIQQGAAISQAARLSKSSSGVMSLYSTLMQHTATSSAVFAVTSSASSLTYPGSLSANA
ncbi:MAG: hypothetical protein EKK53_01450 [Burkholderiales bacterium]|nr:MAG: hypothetical protein EKK53_01450 [Burkholderiales bacterium]